MRENTADFIYDILKARDELPVGHTGRQIFMEYYAELKKFLQDDIENIDDSLFNALQKSTEIAVDFELNGIRIFGQLPPVYNNRILYFRYANFKGKDALKSWLFHLMGSISFETPVTLAITKDKLITFPEISQTSAKIELNKIISFYKQIHQQPQPFFTEAGLKFLQHNPNSGKKISKAEKSKTVFQGFKNFRTGEKYPGEADDPYIKLFFSEKDLESPDFQEITKTILVPFAKYFDEEIEYQVIMEER